MNKNSAIWREDLGMPKGGINFEESNPGGDCGVKKKKFIPMNILIFNL